MKYVQPYFLVAALLFGPAFGDAQEIYLADTARINVLLDVSATAEYPRVLDILKEAKTLAQKVKYPTGEAYASMYTGIAYESVQNYSAAIPEYLEALGNFTRIGDSLGIGKCYGNLGAVFFKQGDAAMGLKYFLQAQPLVMRFGNPGHRVNLLNNLSGAYGNLRQFDKALTYAETAFEQAAQIGDTLVMIYVLNNQGTIFEKMNQPDRAIKFYQEGQELAAFYGDVNTYCRCLANISDVYNNTSRFKAAYTLLVADSAQCFQADLDVVDNYYKNLGESARHLGRYEEALRYALAVKTIDDSIFSIENTKAIREMEAKYENKLLKSENLLQELRLKQQRYTLWATVFVLLVIGWLAVAIWRGKQDSDRLLRNILPHDTIRELKSKGRVLPRRYESASILFTDFKGFTQVSEKMDAESLVASIDKCFRAFDAILDRYKVEKIKTIGDSYMCAAGLPLHYKDHARELVVVALEMQQFMETFNESQKQQRLPEFPMRIGIHSGPVVAGVVGTRKFTYDIWGDTVNVAARMESAGVPEKVNISKSTFELLGGEFDCIERGKIETKNKDPMEMYFVLGPMNKA